MIGEQNNLDGICKMLALLLSTASLTLGPFVSPSWHVRPTSFETMKSSLIQWRKDYDHGSDDFNSTLEMIAWHKTTEDKPACVGLYDNNNLRALAQMRKLVDDDRVELRSIITPRYETEAGTILLKMISKQTEVDWQAMKANQRWYIATIFARC